MARHLARADRVDARPTRSRDRRGARTAVRPRPDRRPGRPRPLPRARRSGRRPGPRAGRRDRAPGRSRSPRQATSSPASISTRPCSTGRGGARPATASADRLTLVEADLVGLRLPDAGRFGLAFIALNSLLVLPEPGGPAGRPPGARRPPRAGRPRGRRHLAARRRGSGPVRRADHARVAAARPRDRRDRDQGRVRPPRRGGR